MGGLDVLPDPRFLMIVCDIGSHDRLVQVQIVEPGVQIGQVILGSEAEKLAGIRDIEPS